MPDLTPKQAKFAELYVELGNASEAYRRSYDVGVDTAQKTVRDNASQLLANAQVSHRLFELQEAARERNAVTVDSITAELNEAREMAKKNDKSADMINASNSKAKLHGLLSDTLKIGGVGGGPVKFETIFEREPDDR